MNFLKEVFHDMPGLWLSIWGKAAGLGHFSPGSQTFIDPEADTLVVYVHGFLHDKSAFRRYAAETPGSWMMVNLPSTFCRLEDSADFVAGEIQNALGIVQNAPRIFLVGHSWGGIISAFLSTTPEYRKTLPIAKVVCIASPFHGTKRVFWKFAPSLKQMDYGSVELNKVRAKVLENTRVEYFSLFTQRDHVVIPWKSCLIDEKASSHIHHQDFPDLGHHSFLYSQEVIRIVMSHLFETPD